MKSFSSSSRILRKLPRENAFYFFTSIGNYTGVSAESLEEFIERIKEINTKSLEFHLYRGDFQKWADETLEDKELAEKIRNLQLLKPVGNTLRDQLCFIALKRFEELKRQAL